MTTGAARWHQLPGKRGVQSHEHPEPDVVTHRGLSGPAAANFQLIWQPDERTAHPTCLPLAAALSKDLLALRKLKTAKHARTLF